MIIPLTSLEATYTDEWTVTETMYNKSRKRLNKQLKNNF